MKDLVQIIDELHGLRAMKDELDSEIEALQDQLKTHMTEQGTDELRAGAWKVTWRPYERTTFDTKRLRKEMPEVAEKYTGVQTLRRFMIV